eukprot:m.136202 g.136202  ORF g.136202 m.136202 type:complete len:785 (-) comp13133_c3_seq1:121-2475(-)
MMHTNSLVFAAAFVAAVAVVAPFVEGGTCDFHLTGGFVPATNISIETNTPKYITVENVLNGNMVGEAVVTFSLPYPVFVSNASDNLMLYSNKGIEVTNTISEAVAIVVVNVMKEKNTEYTFKGECVKPDEASNYAMLDVVLSISGSVGESCMLSGLSTSSVPYTGVGHSTSLVTTVVGSKASEINVSSGGCTIESMWMSGRLALNCDIKGCVSCNPSQSQCERCFNALNHGSPNMVFATGSLFLQGDECVAMCSDDRFFNSTSLTCQSLNQCNDNTEYESSAPTATSNRVCLPVSQCKNGTYELVAATTTTDTLCVNSPDCKGVLLTDRIPHVCQPQCPQGQTWNEDTSTCDLCANEQYEMGGVCVDCPEGFRDHDLLPTTSCIQKDCANNEIVSGSDCVNCGAGHEYAPGYHGSCNDVKCPLGTYDHDKDPTTPCVTCQVGFEVVFDGAAAIGCDACVGTLTDDDLSSTSPCVDCEKPVIAHTGSCEEVTCPENTELVIGVCLPTCNVGQEYDSTTGECRECPTDTFSLGVHQPRCLPYSSCSPVDGNFEIHSGTATSDTVCQQCRVGCDCTPQGEANCEADVASSAVVTSASSNNIVVFAIIGAIICIILIVVAILLVRRKNKEEQNKKAPSHLAPVPPTPTTNSYENSGDMIVYDSIDTRVPPPQQQESIYDSVDDSQRYQSNIPAGMDVYGRTGPVDPSALYSVPVKKKQLHPDGLLYADIAHVKKEMGQQEVIHGDPVEETTYATVNTALTLKREQDDIEQEEQQQSLYSHLPNTTEDC